VPPDLRLQLLQVVLPVVDITLYLFPIELRIQHLAIPIDLKRLPRLQRIQFTGVEVFTVTEQARDFLNHGLTSHSTRLFTFYYNKRFGGVN
jgi:hypothetical protein